MRRPFLFILILFALPAFAQFFDDSDFHSELESKAFDRLEMSKAVDPLMFLVTTDSELGIEQYRDIVLKIKSFPEELKSDRFESLPEAKKIKKIFKHFRSQFFKRYQLYHTYGDLMTKGEFNCISGTAFYALLFKEMGYEVHIFETPFHTFLELKISGSESYLIESTDAVHGVVENSKKIDKRKQEYAMGDPLAMPQGLGNSNEMEPEVYMKEINLRQLAGLQYYNSAVVKFNEGHFQDASRLLKKASYLYPSPRIIMLQMLSERFYVSMN